MTELRDQAGSLTGQPMREESAEERIGTVVIGAGQCGLAAAFHLRRRGLPFVVLDGGERVGDQWRQRWDSLRLFTPGRSSSLPGWRFPAPGGAFPTKDEMGDYLEAYARRFELPVRSAVRVRALRGDGDDFVVETSAGRFRAEQVIVATGRQRHPKVPDPAADLDPSLPQLHSVDYRNPGQLPAGPVLVVGAGNSGADLALELRSAGHQVWLSGPHPGEVPFRIEGRWGPLLVPVVMFAFKHVVTIRTPMGRAARRRFAGHSGPLVRNKKRDLVAAGVDLVPRVTGVCDGRPQLEDGRVLAPASVLWCTGFRESFDWIDIPGLRDRGPLETTRGVSSVPGLYFLGRFFEYALSSEMIQGAGRDAEHVVQALERRVRAAAV